MSFEYNIIIAECHYCLYEILDFLASITYCLLLILYFLINIMTSHLVLMKYRLFGRKQVLRTMLQIHFFRISYINICFENQYTFASSIWQSYNSYQNIHIESIFLYCLFADLMNKYVVNYLCIWYVYKSSFISYWIQFHATTFLRNNRVILFYFDSCKQIVDFIKNIVLYQKFLWNNIAR